MNIPLMKDGGMNEKLHQNGNKVAELIRMKEGNAIRRSKPIDFGLINFFLH